MGGVVFRNFGPGVWVRLVMTAATRGRRTNHPWPFTLSVRHRSGSDNRGNFTPTGVGTTGSEKSQEKQRGRPTKRTYITQVTL